MSSERYITIPKEISFEDIWDRRVLSPSLYEKVICPNSNLKTVRMLLKKNPPTKGIEVGSSSYVDSNSLRYFIRNRAIQDIGYLFQRDSTSVLQIKPQSFTKFDLSKGDILYSKDSNIGECCIIESDFYKENYMISSGILKLEPSINPYYLFGFLKHPFVKGQLLSMTAKGSTIKHSGFNVLECQIPFPTGNNAGEVVKYIASLVETVVDIEASIREKDKAIHEIISKELQKGQNSSIAFNYDLPTIKELEQTGRLDASIYSREFKEKMFSITNYKGGFKVLTDRDLDFNIKPGPSLEFKILRTRIDYDHYFDGCYTLVLPTNISEHGVLDKLEYMGTARKIEELKFGDIIIGESGTWRSVVILSDYSKCITNAHGIRLRHRQGNLTLSIFVRCMLAWYYREGVFNLLSVGGSGGHLSPNYFNRIAIPNFSYDLQEQIANLYYQQDSTSKDIGITQLNGKRFKLLDEIALLLDNIINDKPISLPDNS